MNTLSLIRSGHGLVVSHDPLGITDPLCTSRIFAEQDELDGALTLRARSISLIEGDVVWPTLGLLPVITHLARRRCRVTVTSDTPIDLPPVAAMCAPYPDDDPSLPPLIAQHISGLITHGSAVDRARLIAQIAHAYPTATIAVVIQSRRVCRQLRHELALQGISPGERVENCHGELVDRVVVLTASDMADDDVAFGKRHIVILPRATDALQRDVQYALSAVNAHFRSARRTLPAVALGGRYALRSFRTRAAAHPATWLRADPRRDALARMWLAGGAR